MAVILEIINRSNRVLKRHTLDQHDIMIGRGYDNDLILADPYISPRHARLKEVTDEVSDQNNGDGIELNGTAVERTWQLEDLASTNGVYLDKHHKLSGTTDLHSGDKFTLGRTQLRIMSPDHPVAPALAITPTELFFLTLSRPGWVILLSCLAFGITALNQYLVSFSRIKGAEFSLGMLGVLMIVLVWPGFCALLGRMFRNEPRFLTHLSATLIYIIAGTLVGALINIIQFNLEQPFILYLVYYLGYGLLAAALIALNLRFATHQTARNRQMIAHAFAWTVVGINILTNFSTLPDYQASPRYNTTLLPYNFLMQTPVAVEPFLTESESVFDIPLEP